MAADPDHRADGMGLVIELWQFGCLRPSVRPRAPVVRTGGMCATVITRESRSFRQKCPFEGGRLVGVGWLVG